MNHEEKLAYVHEHVVRFRYYQLQSSLRTLRAPRNMLHKPVAVMKEWIIDRAGIDVDRVYNVVRAIHEGAASEVAQQQSSGVDADEVVRLIDERLETAIDDKMRGVLEELRRDAVKYKGIEVTGVVKPKKLKVRPHAAFERAMQLASQRVNVLLVGPAGCGKTYLGKQVADALDLEFGSISCSAGMSESQLAGWLLPTGTGGKFEYVPSPFVTIYENGGLFLIDEIDAGDPNTLTFTNKAIANEGFFIPQRLKQPYVKKHKDFACFAAANTYGNGADSMYVGRNQLDAATLDRFRAGTITMDYDRDLERELIHPGVLEWGWKIREGIRQHRLQRIMSTRVMLDLTKMTEAYKWDREQWETTYFSDWSEDERRRVAA